MRYCSQWPQRQSKCPYSIYIIFGMSVTLLDDVSHRTVRTGSAGAKIESGQVHVLSCFIAAERQRLTIRSRRGLVTLAD